MMTHFESLLENSVKHHGHLCAGQVIGVRMSMLGLKLIGVDLPIEKKIRKKIMVYVEIDRCATDAIQSVTGCSMGKRTLKFRDYGINAATFLNLETGVAYRIVSTEESRKLADRYAPQEETPSMRQLIGYKQMPDEELFDVAPVAVNLENFEMPGPPQTKAVCSKCGQVVRDGRQVVKRLKTLCRPCAGMAYFTNPESEGSLRQFSM